MAIRYIRHVVIAAALAACSSSAPPPPNTAEDRAAAQPGLAALAAGDFARAADTSTALLSKTKHNSLAAATRGLANWIVAGQTLLREFGAAMDAADKAGGFPHERIRASLERARVSILQSRADFAIAARDRELAFSLCLACWQHDWNGNGRIDERDGRLLSIDIDKSGQPLELGDPRRKPTYGFDVGDAHWAHAMASFQAAALDIVLAFDGSELDKLLFRGASAGINIRLIEKNRIERARKLILEGLESSDAARRAYLAETDDNVEWVPNPNQNSYPMPLDVDATLYETWEGMLSDVRDLVRGDTGISMAELSQLEPDLGPVARPTGYLDVSLMLRDPRSIRFNPDAIASIVKRGEVSGRIDADEVLRELFGRYYKKSMKPSPITGRLLRMKSTLERGGDTLERKLMYLLWLN